MLRGTVEGRTRVNWLVRQLNGAPKDLRIDAYSSRSRSSLSELLSKAREAPELLLEDEKRPPVRFRLVLTAPMGIKRGAGKGGFITSDLDLMDRFYETTVQDLKRWTPSAPKLKSKTLDVRGGDAQPPSPGGSPEEARPAPLPPAPPASALLTSGATPALHEVP